MRHQQFMAYHRDFCRKARELVNKKGSDYADVGDTFSNLRLIEHLGMASTVTGVFARMLDKISRIAKLSVRKRKVEDETVHDTLVDLVNYTIMIAALIEEEQCKDHSTRKT